MTIIITDIQSDHEQLEYEALFMINDALKTRAERKLRSKHLRHAAILGKAEDRDVTLRVQTGEKLWELKAAILYIDNYFVFLSNMVKLPIKAIKRVVFI